VNEQLAANVLADWQRFVHGVERDTTRSFDFTPLWTVASRRK